MTQKKTVTPVAVIGMACLFPKAPGVKEYWRLLYHGEDAITEVPETHWKSEDYYHETPKTMDHTYCTRGGYLSPVPFNPAEFGLPPNLLEATDTSQILGLVGSKMALKDAGYTKDRDFDRDRVSIILGATVTQELVISLGSRLGHPKWRKALEDSGIPPEKTQEVVERISESYVPWQESSFPGLLGNVISGRIANRFDFGGTNTTVDSACASSFSAINLAFMELQSGRSDMVITGGVDTLNDIFMHMCFAQTGVLSHSGSVNAFSDKADGTVLGEGVGILILKPLPLAEKDGDKIYAVIRSVAGSSDGKSLSIYAPSAKGQAKSIRRAYDDAGFGPDTVEMIEAHGTGTRGDAVEFEGLTQVFSDHAKPENACALGSVKSNIGHAKAAAGVAGLIKGILALQHKVLPPTIHVGTPDPKLNIKDSHFYLCTESRPWLPPKKGHPRRCGVTACGFGGSNFHVVLEEYQGNKDRVSWDGAVEILAFSGAADKDIKDAIITFKRDAGCDKPLWECDAQFRYLAAQSRKAFDASAPCRLLVIVTTDETPAARLDKALEGLENQSIEKLSRQNIFWGTGTAPSGKLAFVFPGQGSQYPHMGKDIINVFPEARQVLEDVNALFEDRDTRLSDIIYPLPDHIQDRKACEDDLRRTDHAQPAIGAISLAMDRVLKRFGLIPEATCGHSYGELTALCSAGWISDEDFLTLSVARGRCMAACGDDAGTMLAVRAPLDELDQVIEQSGIDVILANRNSYEQGVLSGSFDAIDQAEALCREKGFRTTRLPVAAAFHSKRVESAAQPYGEKVKQKAISPTEIPVFANTTGKAYPDKNDSEIKDLLAHQLIHPVRFVDNVEALYNTGVRTFVEVGPKPVLGGLVSAVLKDKEATVLSMDASSGHKFGLVDLASVLCRLAAEGRPVGLDHWEDPVEQPEKQAMSIPICGANHRNPVKPRPKTTLELPKAPVAETRPLEKNTQERKQPVTPAVAPVAKAPEKTIAHPKTKETPKTMTQPPIVNDVLQVIQEGLKSMQAIQAQTAQAHNRFLEAQAQAGQTLQDMMDKAQAMLNPSAYGQTEARPVRTIQAPVRTHERQHEVPPSRPEIRTKPVPAPAPKPVDPVVEVPIPAAPGQKNDIEKAMLDVVSDLTGYPVEMIGLDMDIEADLGIDSIKRVEIMSEFEERMPNLSALSPDAMGSMKTLGAIVDYVVGSADQAPAVTVPRAPALDLEKISKTMLEVVSDLTGYPVEMIGLDMDIEADLGIDSIKRVEIMSEFEERMPDLPALSPDAMGSMKTLGAIVSYVAESGIEEGASPQAPALDLEEITQAMLGVVSDLTGYPVEMIGLDMDIEADLGIDSIKRVEIMSEFEERMPNLPPMSPDDMGSMKTLGSMVQYMAGQMAQAPGPVSAAVAVDKEELTRAMLEVVSDLTGYPVDMIGLDMDIEGDLGIDSIKRVEIMSEFEERMPDLPMVSPDAMGTMKTLEAIVSYIAGASAESAEPAADSISAPVDIESLTQTMLEVVSDLTGYPVEMIDLHMDIEGDLGIDSIKRVEIMSEFEERVGDFPQLDAEHMGTLKTLASLCGYIASQLNPESPAPEPKPSVREKTDPMPTPPAKVSRQVVAARESALDKGLPLSIPFDKTIYITDDGNGLSQAIASEMAARKFKAELIPIDGKTPDAAGLIIIPPHKVSGKNMFDDTHSLFLKQAFELARNTGKSLMDSAGAGGAFFATVTHMDGSFGFKGGDIETPVLGGLSGLPKTAIHEWENVSCKALDVDLATTVSETLARDLVDELLHHGPSEVGFSGQTRYTLTLSPEEVSADTLHLGNDDVVLVTGGAKGVTAVSAIALAEASRATIVLMGRSPEPGPEPDWLSPLTEAGDIKKAILAHEFAGKKATPAEVDKVFRTYMGNREVRKTMARIKDAGGTPVYLSTDVRDSAALAQALSSVTSEYGPVTAVIHGAGVVEDRFIVDQTPEQFDRVYGTKVEGLENLLKSVNGQELKYLVCFSSVSARVGNSGQVAYAMANEVLNKVCRTYARRTPQCHVVAINWGPWDGGMVSDSLKKEFARKNVDLIPLKQGAQSMVDEMATGAANPIEVVIGGTFPTLSTEPPSPEPPDEKPKDAKHLSLSFKKDVDSKSYPVLKSHMINQKHVVPFALMTEWIGHGALHRNPGFVLHGLDGMRVLQGIKIDGHPKTIRLMTGKPEKAGAFFEVDVEIRNGNKEREEIHSRARAVLTERLPEAPSYTLSEALHAKPYARALDEAYDAILFHGPQLKGLQEIKGYSDQGMVARVASAPSPAEWISDPLRTHWVADPLVLDSAYQMAILWCYEEKGRVSLPSYSASYRQYTREFPSDGMTVVMEVKGVTDHKMTSDFTFLDNQSTVVATISGYEAVMDDSLMSAFGKEETRTKAPLFDRDKLLAYAIGKPSEAFGKPYEVFDTDRIIARLPGPPYFFMDSVTQIDHPAWELKPGGWIEAEYTVPSDEWYFRANRSEKMPFCVLLEIALQPCGWLAAYAGSALRNTKQLKFRNLGGKAVLTREVDKDFGTLTMRTRMTKVSEAAGMIIEDFDIQIIHDGELIYDGYTNFGFFTNDTMEQQVGIRNPDTIIYTPTKKELKKAQSVDFSPGAPLSPDDTDTDDHALAALPSKALLMIDGIECYIPDGGPDKLGYVRGYKTVDPDEWFFKAHFYQDPVCPGSLGIESFIQLIKFVALEKFSRLADSHEFEFITGIENEWLYRGQVIPRNKKVEVTALITRMTDGDDPEIMADGYLCVDGLLIYQMKDFGVRLKKR